MKYLRPRGPYWKLFLFLHNLEVIKGLSISANPLDETGPNIYYEIT